MVAERIDLTQTLIADLSKVIGAAQVDFDHMTRTLYSTDASNYQMMPVGVTFPRNADDVVAIQELANKYKVPVLPRGGGSSLAGQTVNEALVMDFSRHMRRVRGVNAEARTVDVENGLVLGTLNRQVASLGLMYGPDPASAERATIGGCIGNNATGAHSIRYGMTADNIARLQVVLPTGELVWLDDNHPTLNRLRETVSDMVVEHKALIDARYPKTWRTVAGYALNKIDPDDVNLNWLFAGAEGTLGTVVRAELKLVHRPAPLEKRLALVHFDTLRASLEATPRILELNPEAVELMDRFLINKTRMASGYRDKLTFIDGDPASVLIVEFVGENNAELTDRVDKLQAHLHRLGYHGSVTIAETPEQQADVWTIRKAGLGLIMSERSEAKPIAFVEDASVPVENLADYITDVDQIIREAGTEYAIYAHASAGCLHVRPLVNLKTLKGREQYRSIAEQVTATVIKYQGTITGEHGKGIARGEFGKHLFGDELTDAFRQLKRAFDPDNLLNPGKVVDTPAMDDPAWLRYTPAYEVIPLKTRHDWSADNGLGGAVEMCNGAGVCRKEGTGTMCPSYMATLDEAHSTRGRANALRAAISGRLPDGVTSEKLKAVYDLCLSCKACKSECPSSVDVAKMKSEFLALYHDEHGTPLTTRVFGNIHKINQLAGMLPGLSNFMLRHPLGQWAAKMIGIPTQRPLPQYKPRFTARLTGEDYHDDPDAVLIIDTFTQWNHPEVGQAVRKLANALGVKINYTCFPNDGCCGRPAMSKGLLDYAKRMANTNVRELSNLYPDKPLLFLEPSCMSALTDDYLTLVDPDLQPAARQLAARCVSAEAWLLGELTEKGESLNWDDMPREIMLHGHCHQKALWGTAETRQMMEAIPHAAVTEIDSGCCGVAGSFGYEHYDLSMKIGNDRLLPAIEANPDAIVAAPGTSCRAQIHDAGHAVQHPVEVVANALRD
jgi:FAD/FMN-containing dehydrogenase/Fe-S oxidoreductase